MRKPTFFTDHASHRQHDAIGRQHVTHLVHGSMNAQTDKLVGSLGVQRGGGANGAGGEGGAVRKEDLLSSEVSDF